MEKYGVSRWLNVKVNRDKLIRVSFWIFMAIGIFARVWQLADMPGGVNQDEAFGAYEAYSLLHYGVDSNGHAFPVYLETWGSGMSALYAYLSMPFIAIFGLETWVVRIPQVLVACLTLCAVYGIMKRVLNETAALCCLFLLAVSPWHIMMSRWGIDANIAPGFVIFGLYFFIRGLENSKYFIVSAFLYGLSLYCYATIWPFVPLMILLQAVYSLLYKKVKISKGIVFAVILLFLLALPLLLFLMVNKGFIEEIHFGIFTIPRIAHMRASEISFSGIIPNLKDLLHIIKKQSDGLIWNSVKEYGIFYQFTLPFFFFGLFMYAVRIIKGIFTKQFCMEMFLMVQLLAGGLIGLLIDVNINRMNILFVPMIIVAASGVYFLCELSDKRLLVIPLILYMVSFVKFEKFYFTDYKQQLSPWFAYGIEEALEEACLHEGTIYVNAFYSYPRIMYYRQIPVTEYLDTVERYDYEDGSRSVDRFDRFCFEYDENNLDPDAVYLVDVAENLVPYENGNYELKYFENYMVAVPIGK